MYTSDERSVPGSLLASIIRLLREDRITPHLRDIGPREPSTDAPLQSCESLHVTSLVLTIQDTTLATTEGVGARSNNYLVCMSRRQSKQPFR